jgi:hypothetical protein
VIQSNLGVAGGSCAGLGHLQQQQQQQQQLQQ